MPKYGPVTSELVEQLRSITGAKNVLTHAEERQPYSTDESDRLKGHMPDVVVRPADTSEVSRVLALADRLRVPVTPRGGGTGLAGGAVPLFGGIVLSMERLNHIKEIDQDNFVIVAEPGVILSDLCDAVESQGLYYPVYPGQRGAHIGGNVSTNAGGIRAVKYGVTRSFLLGLEAVLPTGETIRTGGKFVKCSTGYDLTQLIAGSEGTLAVVTEVMLRLIPPPASQEILFIPFPTLEQAIKSVPEILKHKEAVVGLEFMEKDVVNLIEAYTHRDFPFHEHAAFLLIILEGESTDEVLRTAERVGEVCTRNGAVDIYVTPNERAKRELLDAREKQGPSMRSLQATGSLDVVLPRSRVAEFVFQVKEVSRRHGIQVVAAGHAGDGNVHVYPLRTGKSDKELEESLPRLMQDIFKVGVSMGGMISGEHGIGIVKKPYLGIALSPERIALMARLKKAFDPNSILNPGKLFDAE